MDIRLQDGPEGPLRNIKVIDITTQITGPLCSQELGDLGADVIKIEPLHGEIARWSTPPEKANLSGYFCQINRNKRSLSLDLKSPEGIKVLKKLAETADVLVENFRGGVADKLGIGYEDLKKINKRLIYVSITGFGSTGPRSTEPAYDMLMQGMVGMMPIQGKAFTGKPQLSQSAIVDKTTGITAAGVTLAALYARDSKEGTGLGQRVDVPMMDAYAANALPDVMGGDTFVPSELPEPSPLAVLRTWETADGYAVGMALMDNHFAAFCEALECPELLEKPGCRNLGERYADFDYWLDQMAVVIKKFTTEDFLAKTKQAGIPFGPVKTVREFYEEPQVKNNRTIFDVEHPEAGTMRYVRYPGHLSATPASFHRHPPRLGEHNDEILAEIGYKDKDISALKDKGVIN